MQSLSFTLYMISFIVTGIGVIVGAFSISNNFSLGFILILLGAIGGTIIFAQGKIIQLLLDKKMNGKVVTNENETVTEDEESSHVTQEDVPEPPSNSKTRVQWKLSELERERILAFYEGKNQEVEDIVVSPYAKYCIIKVEEFIDVIEIRAGEPNKLARDEVEALPKLHQWIEEEIFGVE